MELTEEVHEFVNSYSWMGTTCASFLELLIDLDFRFLDMGDIETVLRREERGPCVNETYSLYGSQILLVILESAQSSSGYVADIDIQVYFSRDLFESMKRDIVLRVIRRIAGIERTGPDVQDDLYVYGWNMHIN